jgi:hypothetical protein
MSKKTAKSSALDQFNARRQARVAGNTNDSDAEFADDNGMFLDVDSIVKLPTHSEIDGVHFASVLAKPIMITQRNISVPVIHFVFVSDPIDDESYDDLVQGVTKSHALGERFGHSPYQLTAVSDGKKYRPFAFYNACVSLGYEVAENGKGVWQCAELNGSVGDSAPLYEIDLVSRPNTKGADYINIESIRPFVAVS